MQKLAKKVVNIAMTGVLVVVAFAPVVVTSGAVWAADAPQTTILPEDWGVDDILQFVLNLVVYGLGAAAVLGTVIAGIMYMTARDSEAQVAKAKTRLFEVIIGLIAWALMYVVLQWLIPGF